ncbi:hypothetical protein [Brevibacillus dissolubilis]|uniref:hypothetical protein n=1 Tax=Brevibacillus dissolubilis TaxID=1844116 RepID=UPI0021005379|nr:hypothetical protein [Brevibacillus dissolubilis]
MVLRRIRPVKSLNRHYRHNKGFKEWVKANESYFKENPEVFSQLVREPMMVNLFTDMMMIHSPKIQRRLSKAARRKGRGRG